MTYLVVRLSGAIGLSDTLCVAWSFEIPEDVDRYQVLREARDVTSDLHRLLTLQVALMAKFSSADSVPDSTQTMLAIGRTKIAEAMRCVGTEDYDAMSVGVLQAALLLLTIEITGWTLVRIRADGARHAIGYRAGSWRGRSSSPIRFFDPLTLTATTRSGNRYVLIGDPSEHGLDDPLVLGWRAIHDLSRHDIAIIDVEDL